MDGFEVFHEDFDFFVVGVLDRVQENKFELEVELDFFIFQYFPDLIDHGAAVFLANEILFNPTNLKQHSFLNLF